MCHFAVQVSSIANPVSLAVDWVGERIYILDAATERVFVTDTNGNNKTTVVRETGGQPLDIVCDPSTQRIFWSTLQHGILSASMDGSHRNTLAERGIEWASGLTIDYPTQRLYWADHRKGTVETIQLNGKGRHIVTQFRNRSECLAVESRLAIRRDILISIGLLCVCVFVCFSDATETTTSV